MSEVNWLITNPAGGGAVPLHTLGLEAVAASYRTNGPSRMTLSAAMDFDTPGPWYGTDQIITIWRQSEAGTFPFFTGRLPGSDSEASGEAEGRTLELTDPWDDLGDVIYEENWRVGTGTQSLPMAVLGLDSAGDPITTGTQIHEALAFAISRGAYLAVGTIPTGVVIWPSEVRNLSCEQIIMDTMRQHPDWIAWIDHGQNPPTWNCGPWHGRPIAEVNLTAENFRVKEFKLRPRADLMPEGVKIVYQTATTIDDVVYRDMFIDSAGNTSGRRVASAIIDLEGVQMQFQKQRIQVRPFPDDESDAQDFLKKMYPALADLPDAAWEVTSWNRKVVEDEDGHAPPINPMATRLEATDNNDLPAMLVRGQIEDWMRERVGEVLLEFTIAVVGSGGTPEQREILNRMKGTHRVTVTGTSAETKIYNGVTQWAPAEKKPEGIAAMILSAASHIHTEGFIELEGEELILTRYAGMRAQLKNGDAFVRGAGIVHSYDVDIANGTGRISMGPPPDVGITDFFELLRNLRNREVKWWSKEERDSNELGSRDFPGSRGDTITGYDTPTTVALPGGGGGAGAVLGELALSLSRPAVFPEPSDEVPDGQVRVWVNYGFFNDSEPENEEWYFDIPEGADRYFFAVATLVQDAPRVEVVEWEILDGASKGAHETGMWPTTGELPETFALCLGKYDGETGQVSESSGGSIWLSAPIGNVSQSDHVTFDRYFEVNRNGTRYALSADQGI